jgi:hypothetical protein
VVKPLLHAGFGVVVVQTGVQFFKGLLKNVDFLRQYIARIVVVPG